jgi:hypothetical protein
VTARARASMAWAVETLRLAEMPTEEISAVLLTDDPATVRRFLELHRERLEEGVAEQRRRLASLERFLIEAIVRGGRGGIGYREVS